MQTTTLMHDAANELDDGDTERSSGVRHTTRHDGAGGWGLVLVDLEGPPRAVPLHDGAIIGASSKDARATGPGVAAEHARVSVRFDGCYLEDLSAPEGTYVGGVRARRMNVEHGSVVRLGRQVGVFVEHDLATYAAGPTHTGDLVHGEKQRVDWIQPVLDHVRAGASVCIEGPPGIGKRTLARFATSARKAPGDVVIVDGGAASPHVPEGASPTTWVVMQADKLPRHLQLEISHAVGRGTGVSVVITTDHPLDRATNDGLIAPWFAALISGRRVRVPRLAERREDIALIVADIAARHHIAASRIGAPVLEALVRAGWPGGVPEIEAALVTAAQASHDGPLDLASIANTLARAPRPKPAPPSSTDVGLAKSRLEDALQRAQGSVAAAARALGMSRQAIYREAERLGLDIARRRRS